MTARERWGEIAVAIVLALIGLGFASLAWRLPGSAEPGVPGSATAPLFLGLLLIACALAVIGNAVRNSAAGAIASGDFRQIGKPLIGLGLLIACAFTLEPLGFILATFLFLIAGFIALGDTPWRMALPAAATGSLGLWLIFTKLLGVGLPYGLIEDILFR